MKRMTRTCSRFLGSFLNACLLSFALTILLVGSNVAMTEAVRFLA